MFSRLLIITIGLGLLVNRSPAQTAATCPVVTVNGPPGITAPGDTAHFSVQINPVDKTRPLTYKWSVSTGMITSGQGTSEIDVVFPQYSLTATVEVGGLPKDCPSVSSETLTWDPTPIPEKLIEISGTLTSKNLVRIKNAMDKHQDRPNDQFYVIVSGTKQKRSRDRKLTALKSLFKSDPSRATYVLSEKTDDKVTMWAVPPGATPPTL